MDSVLLRTLAAMLLVTGCAGPEAAPTLRAAKHVTLPTITPPVSCTTKRDRLLALPDLGGTPALDRMRALARAKGEPVVFVRAPRYAGTDPIVRAYRRRLNGSRFPWDLLDHWKPRFAASPELARSVLLTEGYLYADRADVAWALWDRVELGLLFRDAGLWIERGGALLHAKRVGSGYRYLDGPDRGKPARLLLFDRVGVADSTPPPPLHRDLRSLAHRLGFDRARIQRRTSEGLLATLRYDGVWVDSVLESDGAKLTLSCELAAPPGLSQSKRRALARERALGALRAEMLAQVRAEVPFDEPKNEWGQQDGHLRGTWLSAYLRGDDSYSFNFDRYPVFDDVGAARPPQVCIDFVTETLERAAGTYFRPRGEPPGRHVGRLDFDLLISGNRRQVPVFLRFAQEHPDMFEVHTVPERRRIPYLFKRRFYDALVRDADDYPAGSIVVIHGFAPWDHYNVPHYHTFFVYETDPVSGMPTLLVGNAGKPRLSSWEPVMARTPGRKIEQVIRAHIDWLVRVTGERSGEPDVPPLLAVN